MHILECRTNGDIAHTELPLIICSMVRSGLILPGEVASSRSSYIAT